MMLFGYPAIFTTIFACMQYATAGSIPKVGGNEGLNNGNMVPSIAEKLVDFLRKSQEETEGGKLWVFLVSGVKTMERMAYATESDISRTYQIAKQHGIPDERIIVFMHDVAGPLFNNTLYNEVGGPNVYEGVPKDYTGEHWTMDNFYSVLKGKEMKVGSKKTLSSGPNDRIFLSFESHGDIEVSMFGDESLEALRLIDTLEQIHDMNRYNKMVIYWMTCFSGSMFRKYRERYENINIYAVSSQTPYKSSLACRQFVDTTPIHTPMCSVFGKNWMSYVESINTNDKTMQSLYMNSVIGTIKETSGFQVPMEWGQTNLDHIKISEFTGKEQKPKLSAEINWNAQPKMSMHSTGLCDDLQYQLESKLKTSRSFEEFQMIKSKLKALKTTKVMITRKVKQIFKESIFLERPADRYVSPAHIFAKTWQDAYDEMSATEMNDCYHVMVNSFQVKCTSNLPRKDWCLVMPPMKILMPLCTEGISLDSFNMAIETHCA